MGNNTSNTHLILHPPSENSVLPSSQTSSPSRLRKSVPDIRSTIHANDKKRMSMIRHGERYERNLSVQPYTISITGSGSRELDVFTSRNNVGVSSITDEKTSSGQVTQPVPDEMYTIEDETPAKMTQDSSLVFDFKEEKDGMFSELIGEDHSKKIQEDFMKLKEQLKAIHNVTLKDVVKLDCFFQAKNEKVYRVFHKQNRKFYALKVIQITTEQQVIAAWEEINSLVKIQNLRNSNLLEVYDIEYHQYDQLNARASLFILMELGAGTLYDYAAFKAKNNLEWEEAELLDIFHHIFKQYLSLKSLGVFHRDIKPVNIVISHTFDAIKFVSYKAVHYENIGSQNEQKVFEEEHDIVGTPLFQAPEITKALSAKASRARYNPSLTDIYSIAITMLAVYNPALQRSGVQDTFNQIREKFPQLYQYIGKLMQESQEMRRRGLATVESQVNEISKGLGIAEMRQFNEHMQAKMFGNLTRENAYLYISTLRNLFLLKEAEMVADHMIGQEQKLKAESEELGKLKYMKGLCLLDSGNCNRAIEEFESVLAMFQRIKQAKNLYMAKTYEGLGRAQRSLGKYDEAFEVLNKSLKIKLKSHTNQHAEIASSYQSIGQVLLAQGKVKDAEAYLDKALEIKKAVFEVTHLEIANTLESLSSLYENQGKFTKALEYCKKALTIKVTNLGQIHPGVGHIYHLLGSIHERQGKYVEALKELEKSLDIKKKCLGENHLEVALTTNKIGTVYKNLGKYPEALKMFYRSLSTKLQFLGEKHPEIAVSYHSIGSLYFVQKQYADALEKFNEAYQINYQYYGEDHLSLAHSLLDIASVNQAQYQYPIAIANYQKALRILAKHNQQRHANSALIYNNLGAIYEKLGQFKESTDKYNMALEIKLDLYGANHPSTAATYNNIGLVLEKQGRFDEALAKLNHALEIKIKHFGEKHPSVASTYNNLGLTYFRQAKPDQALNMYSKALEIKMNLHGEQDPVVADCYYYIGNVYKLQGKKVAAKRSYQQALDIYFGIGEIKNPKIDKVRKQMENLGKN